MFFAKKKNADKLQYDRENQVPVLRCSICTGEQVACLKDIRTGHLEEIMLVKNDLDLEKFRDMTGVYDIPREY